MSSNHITIQMCHNAPPTARMSEIGDHSVWTLHLWDYHNASQAISYAFLDEGSDFTRATDKATNALVDKAYKGIIESYRKSTDPLILSEGEDSGLDVFILRADTDNLRMLADRWADDAIKDLPNVGGDDTYFDYYPDYLSGLHQLCSQLGYPEPYNRFHDALVADDKYPNDPEEEGINLFPPRIP